MPPLSAASNVTFWSSQGEPMLKQFCLAALVLTMSSPPVFADGLPVLSKQRRANAKVVHVVPPVLTPACIERGSPVLGAEPVLLCAPQVVLAPPYDLGASQDLNTITAEKRPPYDQLFGWRYGPGTFAVRRSPSWFPGGY
jgi:hypothetical protein